MHLFKMFVLSLCLCFGLGLSFAHSQEPAAPAAAPAAADKADAAAPDAAAAPADPAMDDGPAPTSTTPAVALPYVPAATAGIVGADVAWMLTSSALVLMMTAPGLALFYGGLVRKKNILGVMMQCFFLMGLMSVVWALWGYSFAFGGSNPYFGDPLEHFALTGVIPSFYEGKVVLAAPYPTCTTVPASVFMVFQCMFFIITPGLICGAFAERMKFSTMCVFMVLWGTFVYCPVCHWVWDPDGFLAKMGALDLAGGTVVHISSGMSALVCSLMLGKRLGFGQEPMPPHNLTYTCIGAALLWVGWFGFNGGSAFGAGDLAANAFVATHMSAAAGTIGWSLCEWVIRGKPSILGACSGAVAGLVCITPASGSCSPIAGLFLGLAASIVCFFACTKIKNAFGYDDSLDAFGVHGVGGILGALLTGVFASQSVTGFTAAPVSGLLEGNAAQMTPQIISVVATAGLAVVATVILLKVLDLTMGLRVTQDEERQGLDVTQHGEEGYIFL